MSAAVAMVVLLYIALPSLIRYGIPHSLSRYGIVSSIEGAHIDLAKEAVTLYGFVIGHKDGPGIRWGEVVAHVDMPALLRGNIRIVNFQVKDSRVDLDKIRTADWNVPAEDSETEVNDARWNVDIGDVVIRDLKFIGLTDQLGRNVELRSLKVANLSHLNEGTRVAFELDGVVGDSPIMLNGSARLVENLPVVEGRYRIDPLDLAGFGPALGLALPSRVDGVAHGSGSFDLHYDASRGLVKSTVTGLLAASGLTVSVGTTSIADADAEWNGEVRLEWPVLEKLPTLSADGAFIAKRASITQVESSRQTSASVEGIRWKGTLRYADALELNGLLEGDTVQAASKSGSSNGWNIDVSKVQVESLHRWNDGLHSEVASFQADGATISVATDSVPRSVTITRPSLTNLMGGDDRYTVERVTIDNAESANAPGNGESGGERWRAIGFSAEELAVDGNGDFEIGALKLDQADINLAAEAYQVTGARAAGLKGGKLGPWTAMEVAAATLRLKNGDEDTWGTEIRFHAPTYTAAGQFKAEAIDAQSVSQHVAGEPVLELSGAVASKITGDLELIKVAEMSIISISQGRAGGRLVEIDETTATGLSLLKKNRLKAQSMTLGALRHRTGPIALLELHDVTLAETGVDLGGSFDATSAEAGSLRYTDAEAGESALEGIFLKAISGDTEKEIRLMQARVDRFSHDAPTGPDLKARGLSLERVGVSLDGAVSANAGTLNSFEADMPDGVEFAGEAFTFSHPGFRLPLQVSADGMTIRQAGFHREHTRRTTFVEIELGRVDPGADGNHVLRNLRAARVEIDDDVAGSELRAGPAVLSNIEVSKDVEIKIEKGELDALKLTDTRGKPAASFSAKKILLVGSIFQPGKLVNLGWVTLEETNAFLGLSEFGRFVLPNVPFSVPGEKSQNEFALMRLENKGLSQLSFFDRSTAPVFEMVISPFKTSIENFHSGDPDAKSQLTVEGSIDEFSGFKSTGQLSIKKDGVEFSLAGKLTAFELKRINTYAAKHANESIRAGRGDIDFNLEIKGEKLSGEMRLVISKARFEPVKSNTGKSADSAQSLSLDSAFAMLKDKDDVVRLTVPFSGSLDDPQFDLSDAVGQAVFKTLKSTVMLTFKPLGFLVSAAGAVGSAAVGPSFNPVVFQAGEGKLSGEGITYLDTLAKQLRRHPNIDLKICGRTVPADRSALEKPDGAAASSAGSAPAPATTGAAATPAGQSNVQSMQSALAGIRALAVRGYLEKKHHVQIERLLDCPPAVETTAGSLPRVDLLVFVEGRAKPAAGEAVTPKPTGGN